MVLEKAHYEKSCMHFIFYTKMNYFSIVFEKFY